jgi:hypothetical protein
MMMMIIVIVVVIFVHQPQMSYYVSKDLTRETYYRDKRDLL